MNLFSRGDIGIVLSSDKPGSFLIDVSDGHNRSCFYQVFQGMRSNGAYTLQSNSTILQVGTAIDLFETCAYTLHDAISCGLRAIAGTTPCFRNSDDVWCFLSYHQHIFWGGTDIDTCKKQAVEPVDKTT